MELLPCFAIILIFALPWWLGPLQMRPISRCPVDAPSMRFALIDFAALIILLTGLVAFLKGMLGHAPMGSERNFGLILSFASLSMMLTAFWGHGTRCLSAHGVKDWRARVVYLLILPLAYLMPAVSVFYLCFLIGARPGENQTDAYFFAPLILLTWPLCRLISKWVASKSTININEPAAAGNTLSPAPDEAPFDPFGPKE